MLSRAGTDGSYAREEILAGSKLAHVASLVCWTMFPKTQRRLDGSKSLRLERISD